MPVKTFQTRKQMFALFMPGFLCGILYVNFALKQYMTDMGIFNLQFLEQYTGTEFVAKEYLLYLTGIRLLPFGILTGLVLTRMRRIISFVFLAWTGFSLGTLLTMAVFYMGLKGIVFCIAGIFPQFLFYIPAYVVVLWYGMTYPQSRWNHQKTIFVIGMMLTGLILEAYVNPVFVKMIFS